jgi:2-oxoglutarate/2-oxoacid ferredoxin oxidoreductase subunit beta
MSYIRKPKIIHGGLTRNKLGLTIRDYEGGLSTLCAGCGHDSVTSALVSAFFELSVPPHMAAKISGIGCSSKTTAYFLGGSHGFNSVHGRMPSVATGAHAAHRGLSVIGVSGDGDSLSIGFGQFGHAVRRNLNMCYVIENNGVYGLTKGQFSASADKGSKLKKGDINDLPPIDPIQIAIIQGGTFVARGFSGDKEQLIPLLKAAISHKGFALVDIISPCVTFNDHSESTKSYAHTRQHYHQAVHVDYVESQKEITTKYAAGESVSVDMHDGSKVLLRKIDKEYNPTDRLQALNHIHKHQAQGEIVTGLLYINDHEPDLHALNDTSETPLRDLPYSQLSPGRKGIEKVNSKYR